jgi:hypothetical protein
MPSLATTVRRARTLAALAGAALLVAPVLRAQEAAGSLPASSPAPTAPSVPPAVEAGSATTGHLPSSSKIEPGTDAAARGWEDSDGAVEIAARGSIEMCEAITLPLVLLPGVGDVIGTVVEWACLIPGVLAVQYTEVHHGQRDILFWQPAVALLAAKLFRDLVQYPAIALAVAAGVGYALIAIPALTLTGAWYFIPVGVAGLVTAGGLGYLAFYKLREKGADWVFETSYALLAHGTMSPQQQAAAREGSWVKPPLIGWPRAWALLAAAAGTEVPFTLLQWIPVAGPWFKASNWAAASKAVMRQTGREVLSDRPRDLASMDSAIDAFATTDAVLGSAGQAMLLGGGVLFFAGTIFAGLQYQTSEDVGQYATIAATTGTTGVVVAATGLGLVLLRLVPRAVRPFVIPALYGFEPDPGVKPAVDEDWRWPWEGDAAEAAPQPAR